MGSSLKPYLPSDLGLRRPLSIPLSDEQVVMNNNTHLQRGPENELSGPLSSGMEMGGGEGGAMEGSVFMYEFFMTDNWR